MSTDSVGIVSPCRECHRYCMILPIYRILGGLEMNFSTPKKTTWYVALVLGIIALIASLFTIPVLTDLAPWLAIVGLALMLAATVMEGL